MGVLGGWEFCYERDTFVQGCLAKREQFEEEREKVVQVRESPSGGGMFRMSEVPL